MKKIFTVILYIKILNLVRYLIYLKCQIILILKINNRMSCSTTNIHQILSFKILKEVNLIKLIKKWKSLNLLLLIELESYHLT